jgi:hypothetical protein
MVHERQGLALGLELRDHIPGVHPKLDDRERDPPCNSAGPSDP